MIKVWRATAAQPCRSQFSLGGQRLFSTMPNEALRKPANSGRGSKRTYGQAWAATWDTIAEGVQVHRLVARVVSL